MFDPNGWRFSLAPRSNLIAAPPWTVEMFSLSISQAKRRRRSDIGKRVHLFVNYRGLLQLLHHV